MKEVLLVALGLGVVLSVGAASRPITAAKMSAAKVTGGFRFDRPAADRAMTRKADFAKRNATPRIANSISCAAQRDAGLVQGEVGDCAQ